MFPGLGMRFESHLGHSVSAVQTRFLLLVLTKFDFSEVFGLQGRSLSGNCADTRQVLPQVPTEMFSLRGLIPFRRRGIAGTGRVMRYMRWGDTGQSGLRCRTRAEFTAYAVSWIGGGSRLDFYERLSMRDAGHRGLRVRRQAIRGDNHRTRETGGPGVGQGLG